MYLVGSISFHVPGRFHFFPYTWCMALLPIHQVCVVLFQSTPPSALFSSEPASSPPERHTHEYHIFPCTRYLGVPSTYQVHSKFSHPSTRSRTTICPTPTTPPDKPSAPPHTSTHPTSQPTAQPHPAHRPAHRPANRHNPIQPLKRAKGGAPAPPVSPTAHRAHRAHRTQPRSA